MPSNEVTLLFIISKTECVIASKARQSHKKKCIFHMRLPRRYAPRNDTINLFLLS